MARAAAVARPRRIRSGPSASAGTAPRAGALVVASLALLTGTGIAVVGGATGRRPEWDDDGVLPLTALGVGLAFAVCGVLTHGDAGARRFARWSLLTGAALLCAVVLGGLPATGIGPARLAIGALTFGLPAALLRLPWATSGGLAVVALRGAVLCGGAACPLLFGRDTFAWAVGVLIVLVSADLWWRLERSRADERRGLLWLVYGIGVTVVGGGHLLFVSANLTGPLGQMALAAGALLTLAVPAVLTIGVRAPRLVDVRQVVSRSLLCAVMLELTVAVFVGVMAVLSLAGGGADHRDVDRGTAGLIAVAVAAAFHPVARRVRRLLDEVLSGGSVDPVATMSALGAQLGSRSDPKSWVHTLRTALSLPFLELWHRGGLVVSSGRPVELTTTIPLSAGDEDIGSLVVGLPGEATSLPRPVVAVLHLVAAPLARSLQAVALAEELRESREHVVVALEEERRRLRRDLHDGLGPVLTGVAYSADAARNLMRSDAGAAEELLAALRDDTAAAIVEIRRIVHGLRPPALDEFGLAGAVRQHVARLRCGDGRLLPVTVHVPHELPSLPAAVEVAAYRIAVEAATNVARHSGAQAAVITLAAGPGTLTVSVRDDGSAPGEGSGAVPWVSGVGLASMRERCEELGGTFSAGPTPAGGLVSARLPVR